MLVPREKLPREKLSFKARSFENLWSSLASRLPKNPCVTKMGFRHSALLFVLVFQDDFEVFDGSLSSHGWMWLYRFAYRPRFVG